MPSRRRQNPTLRRHTDNAEGHVRCTGTPEALTKGWSFLHCLRSSASRILQIPDIKETFWKMMKENAAEVIRALKTWGAFIEAESASSDTIIDK